MTCHLSAFLKCGVTIACFQTWGIMPWWKKVEKNNLKQSDFNSQKFSSISLGLYTAALLHYITPGTQKMHHACFTALTPGVKHGAFLRLCENELLCMFSWRILTLQVCNSASILVLYVDGFLYKCLLLLCVHA